MKKSDLKEKASVFYIGKGVIILSLIVISSLSFILGFFVGKNMRYPVADQASVVTPLAGTSQKNVETEVKETLPQQPQQAQTVQPSEVQRPQEKPEQQSMNDTQANTEIKKAQQSQESKQTKEREQTKENGKKVTTEESKHSQETQKSAKKAKYTVQIGAFKNASEADSLKEKFSKKRYKAFIIVAKTKKHEKLYKVMIGEFGTRKEAELLSVKVKKAEGLRTFVTLKTD